MNNNEVKTDNKPQTTSWLWSTLAPILISLAAIYIAYDQGQETRHHNRLSVTPTVKISFYSGGEGAGFMVVNSGFGPARIKWFKVLFDNEEMPNWKSIVRKLQIKDNFNFTVLYPGSVLSPGQPGTLFWVKEPASADIMLRNVNRIITETCFCSFHDECWRSFNYTPDINPKDTNCAEEKPKLMFQSSDLALPSELKARAAPPTPLH